MRALALLTIFLCVAACGAEPGGSAPSDESTDGTAVVDPNTLPGVYALDVERTTGGRVLDEEGNEKPIDEETLAKVQAGHDPDSFRLEIRADGTFEQVTGMGGGDFRSGGTWKETDGGIELTTTTVDGEPAPEEMRITELYQREKGYLFVELEGKRVYMMKRAELP